MPINFFKNDETIRWNWNKIDIQKQVCGLYDPKTHKHVCNLKCIATLAVLVINGNGFSTYSDNLLSQEQIIFSYNILVFFFF